MKSKSKSYTIFFLSIITIIAFIADMPLYSTGNRYLYFPFAEFSTDLHFENYSIESGLSQGSIRKIFRDRTGFMWFATHDGLNSYDGYSYKVYRTVLNDSNSLSNSYCYSIAEDMSGNIWVGTANGLNKFNCETRTFERFFPAKPDGSRFINCTVYTVFPDPAGRDTLIWYGTNFGLFKLNTKTKQSTAVDLHSRVPFSVSNFVATSYTDQDGITWLGTSKSGLIKFNPLTESSEYYLFESDINNNYDAANFVTGIADSPDGNLLLATFSGLLYVRKSDGLMIHRYSFFVNTGQKIPAENITSIARDHEGYYWLTTNGSGVSRFNFNTGVFKNYVNDKDDKSSVISTAFLSSFVDQSGTVWIGSNGDGYSKYNPNRKKFDLYTVGIAGMKNASVRAFISDRSDNLWIFGYKGIEYFDKKLGKITYSSLKGRKDHPYNTTVFCVCPDRFDPDNFLWLGSEGGGLIRFDVKRKKLTQYPIRFKYDRKALSGAFVYSIYQDKSGMVWAGTELGLNAYNPVDKTFEFYSNDPNDTSSISPKSVNKIYEDQYGNLWIATNQGGISKFDRETKKCTNYYHDFENPHSISSNHVTSFCEDSHGRFWVGTNGGGFNLMDRDKGTFTCFGTSSGLPNDVVYGILEDDLGCLWISTNRGLAKFDPETERFQAYDTRDGLQSAEFNAGAYYKTPKGELIFGGIKGFNIFYPGSIVHNRNIPNIIITDFKLFGKSVSIGRLPDNRTILNKAVTYADTIFLDYTDHEFSFEFTATDYTVPDKNLYSYMLEGFEKSWSEPSHARYAMYTNLDPGEYVFKVKGSNNDGVWNEIGTSIVVIIKPPFWGTAWFKIIVILLIGGAGTMLYVNRVNRIKKYSRKLEYEVGQRTDELASAIEELKTYADELNDLNATKDKFFSIIAHDLKNPIAVLINSTEIIANPNYDLSKDETAEFAVEIHNSSKRLLDLLNNLLTWARSQTGRIEYSPAVFDLSETVLLTVYLLKINADEKLIELETTVADKTCVFADQNMIQTVIRNLVSNAIKFTREGGKVTVSAKEIRDDADSEFIEITVKDNGVGMGADTITKLFRIDMAHSTPGTSNERGTGLGLVLCKEFTERNGGTIRVESQKGEGSSFIFTVPKASNTGLPEAEN